MRLRNLYLILVVWLIVVTGLFTYLMVEPSTPFVWKLAAELAGVGLLFYLFFFYRRIILPFYTITNGMDLLREQDFSSRLGHVGQKETDAIVDIFNRIMEQLKNERLCLREQNHFLDLLVAASPMGVVVLDFDQRIQSLNPAACRILNIRDEKQIAGKPLHDGEYPILEDLQQIPENTSEVIRLGDSNIYKCSHSYFMDHGFKRHFFLLEILTEEVFKAEKKAYEKVIRMISHEVNNTTAGITSTLDTLEATFSEQGDMQDVCEVLQAAISRCYSMSRFITNFADVVRIPEPALKPVSLNRVVTSCKSFMETICMNRNIRIQLDLHEPAPTVMIDAILFEQVLVNILKNAAESIGENGTICIRSSGKPLQLEIGDTGKGISKEVEEKLFSPFFSTKPDGQGIGLIFIREVLLKHGCKFSLRTESDGWTRFRILFPNQKVIEA